MNSLILQVTTRFIFPVLILVALFLLLRGHHEPGGGFIAGLVLSCAVVLVLLACNLKEAKETIRIDPLHYVAIGLVLAVGSGIFPLLTGESLLTGKWFELELGVLPPIKLGTPLLFDVGVFFVVFGITMTMVFVLAESEEK